MATHPFFFIFPKISLLKLIIEFLDQLIATLNPFSINVVREKSRIEQRNEVMGTGAIFRLDLSIHVLNKIFVFSTIDLRAYLDGGLLRNLKLVVAMIRAQQINPSKMHEDIPVEKLQIILNQSCGNSLVLNPNFLGTR